MLTLHRPTRIAVCCCAAAVAGCAKKENAAIDTSSAMASSTASTTSSTASGTVNLADVAGKWNMKAVPMSGDTTATTYVLTATSNTNGWTITFPGRAPIPVKVGAYTSCPGLAQPWRQFPPNHAAGPAAMHQDERRHSFLPS